MNHVHMKSVGLALSLLVVWSAAACAEIVFVDLDDLPLDPATPVMMSEGPFDTTIRFEPQTPEGGPVTDGDDFILWQRISGPLPPADNLPPGEQIGPGLDYDSPVEIAGFELVGGMREPVEGPWFDPSGSPVRGYLGVQTTETTGGDPHYGWIELTVEYDPAVKAFDVLLHGYAYQSDPGTSIAAGQVPEPSTLVLILAAACIVPLGRRRRVLQVRRPGMALPARSLRRCASTSRGVDRNSANAAVAEIAFQRSAQWRWLGVMSPNGSSPAPCHPEGAPATEGSPSRCRVPFSRSRTHWMASGQTNVDQSWRRSASRFAESSCSAATPLAPPSIRPSAVRAALAKLRSKLDHLGIDGGVWTGKLLCCNHSHGVSSVPS